MGHSGDMRGRGDIRDDGEVETRMISGMGDMGHDGDMRGRGDIKGSGELG